MKTKTPILTEDQEFVARITGRMPILYTTRLTAAVLGVKIHDMRAIVNARVILPLAFPLSEVDGYFLGEEVEALRNQNQKLQLVKGRRAMKGHWERANDRDSEADDACAPSNSNHRQVEDLLLSRVRQVEDKVLETYLLAETLFRRCFELPSIRWDLSGTCAGRAIWPDNRIRFNPVLLCENTSDFIREIVPHEIAHLLNRAMNGSGAKPHGPEWKTIMRALGLEPRRCHKYDVTNARVRNVQRYILKCACRTHSISKKA